MKSSRPEWQITIFLMHLALLFSLSLVFRMWLNLSCDWYFFWIWQETERDCYECSECSSNHRCVLLHHRVIHFFCFCHSLELKLKYNSKHNCGWLDSVRVLRLLRLCHPRTLSLSLSLQSTPELTVMNGFNDIWIWMSKSSITHKMASLKWCLGNLKLM